MKIKDLVLNSKCTITLVVKSATARETRAKKPYLALEFYDGTDTINGNYWDWSSGNIPPVNAILDVTANVTEWQGVKQLNIVGLVNNTERHINEFMPTSGNDTETIYKDAYSLLSEVKDDTLRDLSLALMDELRERWLTVPGAVGVHHAYAGGTLIHSYSVARIAKAIAQAIPEANVDLCVVGAMLHDVGKLFTYRINGVSIEMTNEGHMYEHIFMGAELVGNFAEAHVDCNVRPVMDKVRLLRHIILSHHGKLEFGSPVVPQCLEAYIVNYADGLDATAEQIRAAANKTPDGRIWTDRIYTLENKQQITPAYVDYIMSEESISQ